MTQSLGEGEREKKEKRKRIFKLTRPKGLIASYCWKEERQFVVVGLFHCCCCLFCAVSMDSSKVGKCRIACRIAACRVGEKPKQKTHTSHNLYRGNELSPHIRQECCCCCFFSIFLCVCVCVRCVFSSMLGRETIGADTLCFALKA